MGRQRGTGLGGEDVNHLGRDDSARLPPVSTLHERILDSGETRIIVEAFHGICFNLEVTLDDEVLIVGTLEGDVVLCLVLLLKSCEFGIVIDLVSQEVDVLAIVEADTDEIRISAVPKHVQEGISFASFDFVSLPSLLISDEGLASAVVTSSNHRVSFTVSQEYRIDDLDAVGVLEGRHLSHRTNDCLIERSASE